MSFIDLKKKYIEADIDSLLGSKSLKHLLKKYDVESKHIKNADLLLPYIYYKLSKTNKEKAAKLENKKVEIFFIE